jgi:nuclear transport factor 2 (NTF2) superfamily protein
MIIRSTNSDSSKLARICIWEFDELGYMKRRYASINDQPIAESERKLRWERPA